MLLRRSVLGILAACLLLRSAVGASAGDHSVTYAIDAGDKSDVGKIENCEYVHGCIITSKIVGLTIFLDYAYQNREWVVLRIYGPPGCCFSADAARPIYLKIEPTLQRVPIYEGRLRRRNEFVMNNRFGVLYIQFSDLR